MKRVKEENINTSEYWNNMMDTTGVGMHANQVVRYETIARHITIAPCKVVDLGVGPGTCDSYIKISRPQAELTGVDLIKCGKDLKFTTVLADGTEKEVYLFDNFVIGDVTKTGLPSGYFDYAISAEVLEHLEEPQKLVDEMYRLLKPQGRAILSTPYLNRDFSEEHIWSFDFDDITQMFTRAGFKKFWVSPRASGSMNLGYAESLKNPQGNWDSLWTLASKGGEI